jgi:predicted nucleic acid-binding protein
MKGVEIFFDSNIIVDFSTNNDKTKQRVANSLIDNAFELGHAGISAQVMQECIAPTLSSGHDCRIDRFCD